MRFEPTRLLGDRIAVDGRPFELDASYSFRALEKLGGGGPYRGHDEVRWVTVREPHAYVTGDAYFVDAFQQSVAEIAQLRGTPATQILHVFGEGETVHSLVLESLDGLSLYTLVRALRAEGRALPLELALAIAHQLAPMWASSLRVDFYIDTADVVVTPEGEIRCRIDLAADRARQTVGAAVMSIQANVAYIAPEQVRGERTVAQSGMYTLGLLMFEMLVGHHPRMKDGAANVFPLLREIATAPLASISEARADLPEGVARFVDRTLSFHAAERFASWRELTSCLAALRANLPPPPALFDVIPAAIRPRVTPIVAEWTRGWESLERLAWVPVPIPARKGRPTEPVRPEIVIDASTVYGGSDHRPMVAAGTTHGSLLVDARVVTAAEFERFRLSSGGATPGTHPDLPKTMVSIEDAEAYATWAGKRLPTDEEWTEFVSAVGEKLGTGEVWEWTSTGSPQGGRVVRGGRWRNRWSQPPLPENRSHETDAAPDVGFRCVIDSG